MIGPPRRLLTRLAWALPVWTLFAAPGAAQRAPYLSKLHAGPADPLYATYAAALERSAFALDEGYHLLYYRPERGIELTTDTGGDWALAFRRDGRTVHEVGDMAEGPVITTSYPDVARWRYRPFHDVLAEESLLVWTSRTAVREVTLTNTGEVTVELELVPFLRHGAGVLDRVLPRPEGEARAVTFVHEERPDGWMLRHNSPHVTFVRDVILFSDAPDAVGAWAAVEGEPPPPPPPLVLSRAARWVVQARPPADGPRCERPGEGTASLWLDERPERMLSHLAPRWGRAAENVARDGTLRLELGPLGTLRDGEAFTLVYGCDGVVLQAAGAVRAPGRTDGASLVLAPARGRPAAPAPPRLEGRAGGLRLTWARVPGASEYAVYRRALRGDGVYERVLTTPDSSAVLAAPPGRGPHGYLVRAVARDGRGGAPSPEVTDLPPAPFRPALEHGRPLALESVDFARVVAVSKKVELAPGERRTLRIVRSVGAEEEGVAPVLDEARRALELDIQPFVAANERLFASVPEPPFQDAERVMMYWSAFNLMRQVMLPPEGRARKNYFVYSREPVWGWGHGGPVFHESLTMMAYALLDPESAMDAQRFYRDYQHADGYIPYRVGPYMAEMHPTNGELTSSAPWYAWQTWEVYRITRDRAFLEEMYPSTRALYEWFKARRDTDGDGLYEWGGHAVFESVRDASVAVWRHVGWPAEFEAIGLNAMMVKEARALADMAQELGRLEEALALLAEADALSARVNRLMWHEESGFYYHLDRRDNDFTYEHPDDLVRPEIPGLLPLWAGIPDSARAAALVRTLTDPRKFWRPHGVPSLAADDPYYDPRGYWNGPVWVEWNWLIQKGLEDYGYRDLARELVERVARVMIAELKDNHVFWEFYSPEEAWGGHHQTYIWAGLIARMMLDAAEY